MFTLSPASISVAKISRTAPLRVSRPSAVRENGVLPDPLYQDPATALNDHASAQIKSPAHHPNLGCSDQIDGHDNTRPMAFGNCQLKVGIVQNAKSTIVIKVIQPDCSCRLIVTITNLVFRKCCRFHRPEKTTIQLLMRNFRTKLYFWDLHIYSFSMLKRKPICRRQDIQYSKGMVVINKVNNCRDVRPDRVMKSHLLDLANSLGPDRTVKRAKSTVLLTQSRCHHLPLCFAKNAGSKHKDVKKVFC